MFVFVLFLLMLCSHHVLLLLSVELSLVEELFLDMGVVVLCDFFDPAKFVYCLLIGFQFFL